MSPSHHRTISPYLTSSPIPILQERELSHGRLAMFAAAGFIAQETVDQEPWGFYWGLNDAWNAF